MIPNLLKKERREKGNTLFSLILLLFGVLLMWFLISGNIKLSKRRAELLLQINQLKEKVAQIEEKKKEVEKNIVQKNNKEFLEEIARDQLNLKKPGEKVVVVQKEENEEKKEDEQRKKSLWEKIKNIIEPIKP